MLNETTKQVNKMFEIYDYNQIEVQVSDLNDPNVHYFLEVVGSPDRIKHDESFGHAFGIEVRYAIEYKFNLKFKEAMDANGDLVVVDKTMIDTLESKASELLAEEDSKMLDATYF